MVAYTGCHNEMKIRSLWLIAAYCKCTGKSRFSAGFRFEVQTLFCIDINSLSYYIQSLASKRPKQQAAGFIRFCFYFFTNSTFSFIAINYPLIDKVSIELIREDIFENYFHQLLINNHTHVRRVYCNTKCIKCIFILLFSSLFSLFPSQWFNVFSHLFKCCRTSRLCMSDCMCGAVNCNSDRCVHAECLA